MIICMPIYIKEVLRLSYQKDIPNGLYSAIPYTLFSFTTLTGGPFANLLCAKYLLTTIARKLFIAISSCLSAIDLILTSYLGNDPTAVLYLTIGSGVKGFSFSGYCFNHTAIVPSFAGVLMWITNLVSTTPNHVGPQYARTLAENGTRSEWQMVFIIELQRYTPERWKSIHSHCVDHKGHL